MAESDIGAVLVHPAVCPELEGPAAQVWGHHPCRAVFVQLGGEQGSDKWNVVAQPWAV